MAKENASKKVTFTHRPEEGAGEPRLSESRMVQAEGSNIKGLRQERSHRGGGTVRAGAPGVE